MDITKDDLIQRGFVEANTIEETGMNEWRLNIGEAILCYYFDTQYVYGTKLGYKELYISYKTERSTEGFDHQILSTGELDSIIEKVRNEQLNN